MHDIGDPTLEKREWTKPELLFDGELQDTIQAKLYIPTGDPGRTDVKPPGQE